MDYEHRYDDMLEMEHPEPKRHPRMSAEDRAAQFAPFAALTGYDEMVVEQARLTGSKVELDDEQCMVLNGKLAYLAEHLGERPQVAVTWFRQDSRKSGGEYVRSSGVLQNIELSARLIVLRDGRRISLDDIADIAIVAQ